ncbi:MAG: serine hydrolase domain-containing protein, partial [Verrucomicrobiota bacterium]
MKRFVGPAFIAAILFPISTAADLQKDADQHHQQMQSENEGIIFGKIKGNLVEFGSAGVLGEGRAPIDEHSLFEIGSITKTFTGVLLADQVLRGNVKLDDPITKFLPDLTTVSEFDLSSVSLVDLATHTSGFPRLPSNLEEGSEPDNPYAHYTNERLYKYLASFTADDFEEPGKMSYSNLGIGLLGHLLELATGKTYEELLAEVILVPLKMEETYFQRSTDAIPETANGRFATGHRAGKTVSHWQIDALGGAGAIVSSASDMLRYAR